MEEFTIRPAEAADVPGIVRVAERSWTAAYDGVLTDETVETALGEWYTREAVEALVDAEDVGYFVALDSGRVVGYVSGGPADGDRIASLGAIYVDPDHWGAGVGSALLDRFETFCTDEGYDAVEFQVLVDNDVGVSFYRGHGYEVVDERPVDLFGETVEEYVFRGDLA